jgi:hypothetical protein
MLAFGLEDTHVNRSFTKGDLIEFRHIDKGMIVKLGASFWIILSEMSAP